MAYAPKYQQDLSSELLNLLCDGVKYIEDMDERKSALCWVSIKTAALAVGMCAMGMSFKQKESLKNSAMASFEKTFEEMIADGRG